MDVIYIPGRGYVTPTPGNAVQWVDLPQDMPWARVGSWRDEGTPCVVIKMREDEESATETAMTLEHAQALTRGLTEAAARAGG